MATLLSRVRSASKSTTTQTTDASVVTFIQAAVQNVIASIPKELQWHFASAGTIIQNGSGQRPASDTVLSVTRNNIECIEIPMLHAYAQENTYSPTSLNARTAVVPGYYKKGGLVYIKPDPSGAAPGCITSVAIPTITTSTTDTWSFKIIDQVIINYASGLDCNAVGSYWRTQGENIVAARSVTNVEDALTKAQKYLDDNDDVDFESYMAAAEEDDQQAQLMLAGAAQEVNRARAEIEKLQVNANDVVKYYEAAQVSYSRADKFFEIATQGIQTYIGNNSKVIKMAAKQ